MADLVVALQGCVVQRGVALETQDVWAGALVQEQLDELSVAAPRRVVQRGPVGVLGVDLGACAVPAALPRYARPALTWARG